MEIKGWIYRIRKSGGIIFIDLRNKEGVHQIVIEKSNKYFNLFKKFKRETFLILDVSEREFKQKKEYYVNEVINYFSSSDYPIKKIEDSVEQNLCLRHLFIRDPKYREIMLIREEIIDSARDFFKNKGFIEVWPPILVSTACEGGATLFKLDYFDSNAYLSQSAQLYLEALIYSLEEIWSLTPSFRAEKSRGRMYLTEFWHLEAESILKGLDEIIQLEEELIKYISKRLIKYLDNKKLDLFKDKIKKLEQIIDNDFPKISYDEALRILSNKKIYIAWGEDFGKDEEAILSQCFDLPFFIYGFPLSTRAFYVKKDEKNPKIGRTVDLLLPQGYGEVSTGGEREENLTELIKRLKEEGLNPNDYKWYLDLRKYGSVPHSGFGIGIERLLTWICGLDHIRDSIPFPRSARWKRFI